MKMNIYSSEHGPTLKLWKSEEKCIVKISMGISTILRSMCALVGCAVEGERERERGRETMDYNGAAALLYLGGIDVGK